MTIESTSPSDVGLENNPQSVSTVGFLTLGAVANNNTHTLLSTLDKISISSDGRIYIVHQGGV